MLRRTIGGLLSIALVVGLLGGCEQKKTRKVTFEGPEKKTEIKLETTEKKDNKE